MPAKIRDALRQRLDHIGSHHRRRRITKTETDPENACLMEFLELGIRDARMDHGDTARLGYSKLCDGIYGHSVHRGVVARGDNYHARRSDALLKQAVVRYGRMRRSHPRA